MDYIEYEFFISYFWYFVLVLLVAGLFPGGLREIGWKKEGWFRNLLLGFFLSILASALEVLLLSGIPYLFPRSAGFLPSPVYRFRNIRQMSLVGFWYELLMRGTWVLFEESFDVFLLVRLERVLGNSILSCVLVALLVVSYHIGVENPLLKLTSIGFFSFAGLVVFTRTRHIGALITVHLLGDITA